MEHHRGGLYHVAHHHGEKFPPEQGRDHEDSTDLAAHSHPLLRPQEAGGNDGGHSEAEEGGPDTQDCVGAVSPD